MVLVVGGDEVGAARVGEQGLALERVDPDDERGAVLAQPGEEPLADPEARGAVGRRLLGLGEPQRQLADVVEGHRSSGSASSAIRRASGSDEVAAGEGALRTNSARSVRETRKSSTSVPSRATAWARIPGRPGGEVLGAQRRGRGGGRRRPARASRPRGGSRSRRRARSGARAARCRARRASRAGRRRARGSGDRRRGRRRSAPSGRAAPRRRGRGSGGRRETGARDRAPGRCWRARARRARAQAQVGAAEGHDPRLGGRAGGAGEPVGPGAGADDRRARPRRPVAVARSARGPPALRSRPPRSRSITLPPAAARSAGVGGGDPREVDDPGLGRVQGGEPGGVRLDLAQPGARRPGAAPARRWRDPAALELVEALELVLGGGDDQLAAAGRRDPALVAVRVQLPRPGDAEARLQRAGLVVDAGVDDAAGVAGLMGARSAARARARRPAARRGAAPARARPRGRRSRRRRRRRRTRVAAAKRSPLRD